MKNKNKLKIKSLNPPTEKVFTPSLSLAELEYVGGFFYFIGVNDG